MGWFWSGQEQRARRMECDSCGAITRCDFRTRDEARRVLGASFSGAKWPNVSCIRCHNAGCWGAAQSTWPAAVLTTVDLNMEAQWMNACECEDSAGEASQFARPSEADLPSASCIGSQRCRKRPSEADVPSASCIGSQRRRKKARTASAEADVDEAAFKPEDLKQYAYGLLLDLLKFAAMELARRHSVTELAKQSE